MAGRVSIRLSVEGADDIRNQLKAIGTDGNASLADLKTRIQSLGTNFDNLLKSTGGSKKSIDDAAASFSKLRASVDPAYASLLNYQKAQDTVARAVAANPGLQDQGAAVLDRLRAAHDNAAKSAANNSQQMRLLSIQAIQTFSSIEAGMPVMTVLVQQGHQVADQLLASGAGLKGLGDAAKAAFAAIGGLPTVITAGVGVALGYLAVQSETAQQRMATLGQQLRATRTDYAATASAVEDLARKLAASTTLSVGDARSAGSIFGALPTLGTAQIERLTRVANDLATVLGVTVPDAAKKLADAYRDPAAAAEDFAKNGLFGVTEALAQQVKALQQQGNAIGAYELLVSRIGNATKGAAEQGLSPLRRAIDDLAKAFTTGKGDGSSFAESIGGALTGLATQGVNAITSVLNALKDARDWLDQHKAEFAGGVLSSSGQTGPGTALGGGANPAAAATGQALQSAISDYVQRSVEPAIQGAILSLATRIQRQESATGQFSPGGAVVTSPKGALGAFQVLPSTGAGLGRSVADLSTVAGNIGAGVDYLVQLYKKYNGNETLVAMAYNWGPGHVDAFLAKKPNINPPAETVKYVAGVTGGYSLSPTVAAGLQQQIDTGLRSSSGTFAAQYAEQQRAIEGTKTALDALNKLKADGRITEEDYAQQAGQLNARLDDQTKTLNNMRDPFQQQIHSLQLAAQTSQVLAGASRDVAEALQQAQEANRGPLTDAQKYQVTQQVLAKLAGQFIQNLNAISQEIEAQEKVSAAYDRGAQSIVGATNAIRAEQEARQTAIQGTAEYSEQVSALTEKYNQLSAVQSDIASKQQNQQQQRQLEYIQKEVELVTASAESRERELAALKAKQEIEARGGSPNTSAAQQQIELAKQVASANLELQKQQSVISDLQGFADNAFNQIGQAIANAFVSGQGAAVNFKNVLKSIVAEIVSYFAKIAVINPIMNALFGSNKTTIGDVGGLIGRLFSGSSSGGGGAVGGSDFSFGDAGTAVKSASSGGSGILGDLGYVGAAYKAVNWLTNGGLANLLNTNVVQPVESFLGITTDSLIGRGVSAIIGATSSAAASSTSAAAGAAGGAVGGNLFSFGEAGTQIAAGATGAASAASDAASSAASAASAASSVADAAGSASSVIGAVSAALPFVTSTVSAALAFAQKNYVGGSLILAGTAVGAAFGPIGAAVGAIVGTIASLFTSPHPLSQYSATELDARDGYLARGPTVAQLWDPSGMEKTTDGFIDAYNKFFKQLGVKIDQAYNGPSPFGAQYGTFIASLGNGVNFDPKSGVKQTQNFDDVFKTLHFVSDNLSTNFGKLVNAQVKDQTFGNADALKNTVVGVVELATKLDALGLSLHNVNKDFKDISIERVSSNALGDTQLQTALTADLGGKQFGTQQDLFDEIEKVNQFIHGTVPALVANTGTAVSSFRQQLADLNKTYEDAKAQMRAYGLATEDLSDAQARLVQKMMDQAAEVIAQNGTQIGARIKAATGDQLGASLDNFDVQAQQQREQLRDLFLNYYGDAGLQMKEYAQQSADLETALADERLAIQKQFSTQSVQVETQRLQAILQADQTIRGGVISDMTARATLASDPQLALGAQLANFDLQSEQQRRGLADQLKAAFGDSITETSQYAETMARLEESLADQRLVIVKQSNDQLLTAWKTAAATNVSIYTAGLRAQAKLTGDQSKNLQAQLVEFDESAQQQREQLTSQLVAVYGEGVKSSADFARDMVNLEKSLADQRLAIQQDFNDQLASTANSAVTSLVQYAEKLQTGSASPLSPQAQHDLALRQFNAVSGAAAAGDFNSLTQLTGYADSLLSVSRSLYGSGTQYVADFNAVLDALDRASQASPDSLTASVLRSEVRTQTQALQDSLASLQDEVRALRLEVSLGNLAPARAA